MSREDVFSRLVKVEALPRDGLAQTLEATAAERAALARLNGLVEVSALKANFILKRSGKTVRVEGEVHAEVTQTCIVTLEPFAATVDEPVDVRFAAPRVARPEPETIALDAEDPPDPIIDGKIDLGALAAEFLALGLDPYPRKPDALFAPPADADDKTTPFDALADLAKKKN